MKKILLLSLTFILCMCFCCANENELTPARIKYVKDRMYLINEYLSEHLPPKTQNFDCNIEFVDRNQEYGIVCKMINKNVALDENLMFPFYMLIGQATSRRIDENGSQKWVRKIPIYLYYYNPITERKFIIDKNTYN